jgi:FAD/FMN-containing dehydrogenase
VATIWNWAGTIAAHPQKVVSVADIGELQAVLADTAQYPAPVRVYGSNHSTTPCAASEGGTMVRLDGMKRVLEVGEDFVRVEGGCAFIDASRYLAERGMEFYVNLQIGNATIGSIACCATKDGSYPDAYGQASSYCIAMKVVKADGSVVTIDESDPELLAAARSSYGLFGVVAEATFRIRPAQPLAVRHDLMDTETFIRRLPTLLSGSNSVAYYLFPWIDRVVVQVRTPTDAPGAPNRWVWKLRNWATPHVVPVAARLMAKLPGRWLRDAVAWVFYWCAAVFLHLLLRAKKTRASDETMRYRHPGGMGRLTFSLWAFDVDDFGPVLRDFLAFLRTHYDRTGYRSFMLTAGYHVKQDDNALLSYSRSSGVLTIDPTGTGEPGWDGFVRAFNEFSSSRGARPLLNQSPLLTAGQVRDAFGAQWEELAERRRAWDPEGRLLNRFFRELLGDLAG